MCLFEAVGDERESSELEWIEMPHLGEVSVPAKSRWRLDELVGEVDEYFDLGAFITSGATVFDVGANIGVFSLAAARRCGGNVDLFCFEPAPPIFDALSANAEKNALLRSARTHLFPVALGATPQQELKLSYFRELPTDSTIDLDGKRRDFELFFAHHASLLEKKAAPFVPNPVSRSLGSLVASMPTGAVGRWLSDRVTGRVEFDCSLTTISTVMNLYGVRKIDLLKIDVEGAELEVLRGIDASHWPRIRQIVLEGHDQDGRLREIDHLLEERHFEIVRLDRPAAAEERGLSSFLLYARHNPDHTALGMLSRFVVEAMDRFRELRAR